MKCIAIWRPTFGAKAPLAVRRRKPAGRRCVLESLESRVVPSGLTARNIAYNTPANTPLSIPAPGVIAPAYVQPQAAGLQANFSPSGSRGPFHGALQSSSNGAFTYSPSIGYTGTDSFNYQAFTNSGMTSNVATVTITITPKALLLPSTPFFNSLRERRNINPPRFDFYHPKLGAILRLEASGMPAKATDLISANKHFNVRSARLRYSKNPLVFDRKQPVLGALFELETVGSTATNLLPQTDYYSKQRALYDAHPTRYQAKHVYLGALFAIENMERSSSVSPPPAS
jgi:hypothetical protein